MYLPYAPVVSKMCESKLHGKVKSILLWAASLLQASVLLGDQLLHSQYLQCLAALAVGFGLDTTLCFSPQPLHHCHNTGQSAVLLPTLSVFFLHKCVKVVAL